MYFFNLPHTIANMARLVRTTTGETPSRDNLRPLYIQALLKAQGNALSQEARPAINFYERRVCRPDLTEPFAKRFGAVGPLPEEERARVLERLGQAFERLEHVDRRLVDVIQLLLTDLVFVKGELSGAISARYLVGVISVLPSPEWDAARYAETVLHEALHNNIYLGELLYPMWREPKRLSEPESLVLSAIRVGEQRPLNGAFHSACVAMGVAYLRYLFGDDEGVNSLLRQLADCVEGLASKKHLLTDYANAVVAQLKEFVERPDFQEVGRRLSDPGLAVFRAPSAAA